MKLRLFRAIAALSLLASAAPGAAMANTMDLELWRLGNPNLDAAANDRFERLMVDLGLAVTPGPGHPAETLGRSGTSFELGVRYAGIHQDATVAAQGGTGCPPGNASCAVWVNEGTSPGRAPQRAPSPGLLMPFLQVRKGLPFSFELEGKLQYLAYSEMFAATAGVRWTLNEGFDFLPDLSVGGQGTRLLGNRDFGLTTAALDVMIGKWFGVAGMFQLTPYAGWQHVWVSGVSEVLDFAPGTEDPSNPTADDTVFRQVGLADHAYDRFFLGLRFNSYIVQVAVEGTYQPKVLDFAQDTFQVMGKIGLDF